MCVTHACSLRHLCLPFFCSSCQRDTQRLLTAIKQNDEVMQRMNRVNTQLDKEESEDAYCLSCLEANPPLQQRSLSAPVITAAKGNKGAKKK
jgi:hypothetical protein